MENLLETLPHDGHSAAKCDLTDGLAIRDLFNGIADSTVRLNGLVHCAGIHWLRPLQMMDEKSLDEMLSSHVRSSVLLTKELVASRVVSQEGCSVVLLSSAAALQGGAGTVAYAAAKGALISAARVLAVELAKRNIRVNAIAPGVVRTPQSEAFLSNLSPEQLKELSARHLLGLGEPSDIAGVIAFLLSPDARWITGSTIVADGGLTAH